MEAGYWLDRAISLELPSQIDLTEYDGGLCGLGVSIRQHGCEELF